MTSRFYSRAAGMLHGVVQTCSSGLWFVGTNLLVLATITTLLPGNNNYYIGTVTPNWCIFQEERDDEAALLVTASKQNQRCAELTLFLFLCQMIL